MNPFIRWLIGFVLSCYTLTVILFLFIGFGNAQTFTYTVIKNADAPYLDMRYANTQNVTELEQICNSLLYCAGFNSDGYLKYDVSNPSYLQGTDLYIKHPTPPKFVPSILPIVPVPASFSNTANGTSNITVTNPNPGYFFTNIGHNSDILTEAFSRYENIIFAPAENSHEISENFMQSAGITGCVVNVLTANETLQLGFDESYNLVIPIDSNQAVITANTVYGALRALESLAQLIAYDWEGFYFILNAPINITDFPRYAHRGLLIDSSRHFLPVNSIKQVLDGMAAAKLNTLHWHLSDDESFPFVSKNFPLLSLKGSYNPKRAIYLPSDIQDIIQYAAYRGIRVMPEFDMPAHTRSWFAGYPELLGGGQCGFDPTRTTTYSFVDSFLDEINMVFPENYVHLGGDELSYSCWNTTPIIEWMKQNNIASFSELESLFESQILGIASKHNLKAMVWQDVFNNGVKLPPETVVEVWKGADYTTLLQVLEAGYPAVMSGFWYLDNLAQTWADYYILDVDSAQIPGNLLNLLVGGEACMWGEWVDETNIIPRIFPRATAVGEVLWSPYQMPKVAYLAAHRFHQWKCRMERRGLNSLQIFSNKKGINAEPVGIPYGVYYCDPL